MSEKILKIKDAKKIARDFDLQGIVIMAIRLDGTIDTVTYGQDKLKCNVLGWWGQNTIKMAWSIFPFRTVFGWGNGGIPQPFTEEEWNSLSEKTQDELVMAERFGFKE